MALDIVSLRAESDIVIFSDSLSVVRSLRVHCYHPIIRRLVHRIHDLQIIGKTIHVGWIPSYIVIERNELADVAAKVASGRPEEPILINYSDWRSVIRDAFISGDVEAEMGYV